MCLQSAKHSPVLMTLICDELKVGHDDILDFELCLADAVPSVCSPLLLFVINLINIY